MNIEIAKSRRDNTSLTVDFNLREDEAHHVSASPAGTTHWRCTVYEVRGKVLSLRDLDVPRSIFFRRLKPTVIKMPSLRDFVALPYEETAAIGTQYSTLDSHYYQSVLIIS